MVRRTKSAAWKAWLCVVCIAMAAVAILWWPSAEEELDPGVLLRAVTHGIGKGDNPGARSYFEWMRLHDPETGVIPSQIRRKEVLFAATLPARDYLSKSEARQLSWTQRGPSNIGGRTRALAIDRSNENVIIAGGVSGGMWRSDNGGTSWSKTTLPDQHHSVTTVVQDPRPGQENVWYYGTGELIGNSASEPGAPYLGTGLYKSTDGGRTWNLSGFTEAGDDVEFTRTFDVFYNLAIDPSNTQQRELYAATFGLIYRQLDDGEREPLLVADVADPNFSSFTDLSVTDDGVVYATLSSDGDMGGIWRSPDGTNWTDITPEEWPPVFQRTVVGIAPSNPNVVYFLGVTPGGGVVGHSLWKYTYVSGDGSGDGGQWEDRSENLPTSSQFPVRSNFPSDLGRFNSQGGYDLVIAVKPDDEHVVFIGGTNLYRSTDGFATEENTSWIAGYHPEQFIYPNHHPDLHAIAFYPSAPQRMITGDDGGVHRTENNTFRLSAETPVEWETLNRGYVTTQFYSVAIDEATPGDNFVVGGMQDNGTVFTTEETGVRPWIGDIIGGDGAFADMTPGRDFVYVSSQNARIIRLEIDESGDVSGFTRVDPTASNFGEGLFITPFHLDPNDPRKMYLGGADFIFRNDNLDQIPRGNQAETDSGWVKLTNAGEEGSVVTALTPVRIEADGDISTRLYFATFRTDRGSENRIYRLENAEEGDPVPIEITQDQEDGSSTMPTGAYVSSIAVDPQDPSNIMVVFTNYRVRSLFYSGDAGSTWTDVSGNLEDEPDGGGNGPSTRWAEILPVQGGKMYFVATSAGLFSTTELQGENTVWVQEGAESIGNVVVDMIATRPGDQQVVAATHGNGIYSASASDVIINVVDEEELPETFQLSHAYPNPFNPSARFTLRLEQAQQIRVEVYDELGRRVRVLHDGFLPAGTEHVFDFDAADLASGIYTYRVNGERFQAARRAVLVK